MAAAAERAGLSVRHHDRDLERIAHVTGQRDDWVIRSGSAD
jgi:predicted nucleic acid-binding protein